VQHPQKSARKEQTSEMSDQTDGTPIGQSIEMKEKPSSSKLKFSGHQKQISAQIDQVDEIHQARDPIDASL
jgi:hypothetical protein